MTRSFKYVCVGGGNSAGYLAKELAAAGLQPGELCIITDEPVSGNRLDKVMLMSLFVTVAGQQKAWGQWNGSDPAVEIPVDRVVAGCCLRASSTQQGVPVPNW